MTNDEIYEMRKAMPFLKTSRFLIISPILLTFDSSFRDDFPAFIVKKIFKTNLAELWRKNKLGEGQSILKCVIYIIATLCD